ncbi:MAG: hypothetical protein ACK40D_06225 [Cyanobacteriota bacterium]
MRKKLLDFGGLPSSEGFTLNFLIMSTIRNAAILLGLSAGLGLASIQPSQAADWDTCGVTGAKSAMGLFSTFPVGGCQIGDKLLSNLDTDVDVTIPIQMMWSENNVDPSIHTLTFQNAGGLGGSFFNYELAVVGSSESIKDFSLNSACSAGSCAYTGTMSQSASAATLNMSDSLGGQGPQSIPLSTNLLVFNNWTNTNLSIEQVTNSYTQTPGPLPILGAGAAFGFSRKLRNRIKASA